MQPCRILLQLRKGHRIRLQRRDAPPLPRIPYKFRYGIPGVGPQVHVVLLFSRPQDVLPRLPWLTFAPAQQFNITGQFIFHHIPQHFPGVIIRQQSVYPLQLLPVCFRVFPGKDLLPRHRHIRGIQLLLPGQLLYLRHDLRPVGAKAHQHHHLAVPLPGRPVVGHRTAHKFLPPGKALAREHPRYGDLPLLQLGGYLLRPVPHPIQQDGLPRRLQFFPHCPSPLPAKSRFGGRARVTRAYALAALARLPRPAGAGAAPLPTGILPPILPHSPAGRKPPFTKNLQFNLYKSLDNFHISVYNKLASRKRR